MVSQACPLVSVVTPAYNHRRFIGPCIESLLRQTYPNWEQIIIDDGSTDGTAEVVRRYTDPRIHYFHQENQGIDALAQTYNRALCLARGELIAVLEGDDFWPADRLATLVPKFRDPSLVLAYGAVVDVDINGRVVTSGGRVLGVTAVAPTVEEARARAYAAAAPIEWEGMQMRHDIAEAAAAAPPVGAHGGGA